MSSGTVQVLQAVTLAATAVGVQRAMHRVGRPFTAHLQEVAGGVMRAFAAVSELLTGLLSVAFIAVSQPVDGSLPVAAQFESFLDTLALFAVAVVIVQLIRLRALSWIAAAYEPWPAYDAPAATA